MGRRVHYVHGNRRNHEGEVMTLDGIAVVLIWAVVILSIALAAHIFVWPDKR